MKSTDREDLINEILSSESAVRLAHSGLLGGERALRQIVEWAVDVGAVLEYRHVISKLFKEELPMTEPHREAGS